MQDTFMLELDTFKGPLELLLELIEQRKLRVNDIALAQVADDYVRYIQDKERVPLSQTAQFVVVASTLLLIKSRSLLPHIELTKDEEDDIRDLEHRLELYRQVKRAARLVQARWHKKSFARIHAPERAVVFAPAPDITTESLLVTAQQLSTTLLTFVKKPTAHLKKEIRLEDVIENLARRIQRAGSGSFKSLTTGAQKVEAIVYFLALLELVKGGALTVAQRDNFSDILIEHDAITLPRYD